MSLSRSAQHLARLTAGALGWIGAALVLPAQAQGWPSLEACYYAVQSYGYQADLDNYSPVEVYCLFVVEMLDGGIDPNAEYDTDVLDDLIEAALEDGDDAEDGSGYDDLLTYDVITEEYPPDVLDALIDEAIAYADYYSLLPSFDPQMLAGLKQANGRTRGTVAIQTTALYASQRRSPY